MYLNIMSRIEGRKHDMMLGEKGSSSFPYFCAMNATGDVIAKLGGGANVGGFTKMMVSAGRYVELEAKAAGGDAVAKIDFAILRTDLGMLTLEQFTTEVGDAELSESQQKNWAAVKLGLSFDAALKRARTERTPEAGKAFEGLYMKLYNDGTPLGGSREQAFWGTLLRHGMQNKDPKIATDAVNAMERLLGDDPAIAPQIAKLREQIQEWSAAEEDEPEEEPEEEVDEDSSIEESCE